MYLEKSVNMGYGFSRILKLEFLELRGLDLHQKHSSHHQDYCIL